MFSMAGLEPIEELLRIAIGQNVGSASVGLVVRVLVVDNPR